MRYSRVCHRHLISLFRCTVGRMFASGMLCIIKPQRSDKAANRPSWGRGATNEVNDDDGSQSYDSVEPQNVDDAA